MLDTSLIQFKVLHRLHYSKSKLHRIFSNIPAICDKCQHSEANLTHSFTNCIKITNFWTEIFKIISNVVNTNLASRLKINNIRNIRNRSINNNESKNFY